MSQGQPFGDFQQQIDELTTKLSTAIGKILTDWSNQAATNTAKGLDDMVRPAIDWFRNDTSNFVLHTPLELVNALSVTIGTAAWQPLFHSLTDTAMIAAAIAYAGHRFFGWPGIGDSVQRIGTTLLVVAISDQLLDWSVQTTDLIGSSLAVSMPSLPALLDLNPIVLVVQVCVWLVFLARLALVCGKKIAWLAILKAGAPLFLMALLHHKTAWIAGSFVRLWIGWLIGGFLAVLGVALSIALAAHGGFGGYILSCATLMVAHDVVYIFAPKDAGLSLSVGPIRLAR